MMVLYHLHNPDAPAFTHTCNECQTTISGPRYSCEQCKDFDMCIECKKTKTHPHKLKLINDAAQVQSQQELRRRRAQVLDKCNMPPAVR